MARQTLTDDEVRTAMHAVLRKAEQEGRRPTITAVERWLDIPHPTFYRNFPHLIDWFKQQISTQASEPQEGPDEPRRRTQDEIMADLRRENANLRKTVAVYAEALRQLTLDYAELGATANRQAGVTDLASRRRSRE